MTAPTVSVIIVSRGRPEALALCLTGLDQIAFSEFEVIVVADPASADAARDYAPRIKLIGFDRANISAARNMGVQQASGDIVAFIDDDAVPEPTWLTHLIAPFNRADVAAAGGFVIGRNGITFQWQARMAFADGKTAPIELGDDSTVVLDGIPGRAIKTEGTNMAIRRSVLTELGGFDEAFAFYLDETDVNMRLAAAGLKTAIVPRAQVHHGFAASTRRTQTRVPLDLTEIAASTAVFQRKYAAPLTFEESRRDQRNRLLRHMVAGDMMPGDVTRLMRSFATGWASGMARQFGTAVDFGVAPPMRPFQTEPGARPYQVFHARFWQASAAQEKAKRAVAGGAVVTLYLLSFTGLFHRCRFHPDGYWLQTGGQFGRSLRSDPILKLWGAKSRTKREKDRVSVTRVPKMPTITEKSPD